MILNRSFQHQEVTGFQFGRRLIGRPKMNVYIYYIDGLLIDTGQRRMANWVAVRTQNLDVRQIFITHYHEDHSGNISRMRELHRCKAYASPACCEVMKAPPPISPVQQIIWKNRPACPDLIPIGDTLKTANHTFQIIPIPGHAADMVALFEPKRKWLFSADLYINSYIDYMLYNESMAQQIASLKRALALDFEVLFCSHKPQLTDGREKLKKKLHYFETFFENVAREYEKGRSAKEIMKALNLKENHFVKTLSKGDLSKENMVTAVMKDIDNKTPLIA